MASDLEQKAKDAFFEENFELAVDLYTQAISLSPNKAELLADRSQANIKLDNFPDAVADANRAIELDASLAKAYYRKGIACMKLEEYETAKAALEIGALLTEGESKYLNLIKECDERIAEEMGNPQKLASEPPSNTGPVEDVQPLNEIPTQVPVEDVQPQNEIPTQVPDVAPSKPKYRHEFYQKPEEVVVTIFAKGVPADCVSVDFGGQILSVSINVPGEDPYHFQPRLFGKIVPEKCKFAILSNKVEIRLAKAEPIQWNSLEYSKETTVIRRADVSSGLGHNRPTYPSSKPKGVDWDKIAAQVKKEEKEEKLDGDAALNKFFREIYAEADEDTRRAMSKSFVESNGTVLSTNWKEVGSKMVQGSPPDGMEMKKWEY